MAGDNPTFSMTNQEEFLQIKKSELNVPTLYVDEVHPLSFQIGLLFKFRLNLDLLIEEYEKIEGHYYFGEKDVCEFIDRAGLEILPFLKVVNGEADNYVKLARLLHVKRGGIKGVTFGL